MATPADTIVRMNAPARLWRLDCRGSFALWDGDGRLVTIRGRKARAILAYLVTYRHEHVTRERLIQLLWPDRAMAQARGSLRQSLVEIRRAAPGVIISDHEHVWIDMTRLEPIELADNCSPAEQLFDDLEGITSEFDDWLRCERATEASEKWVQLQRLVEGRLKRGEGASAIPLIERMQRIDPYNEEWLRLAMRADAQAGHPAGIQTRFRELNELLKQDLDVSLSPQTRALHDELLRDLAKPNGAVDVEVEQTIVAPTESQPSNDRAQSRWAFRRPTLVAVGFAALATTLGLTQSVRPASMEPNRIAVLPFRALDGADSALAEGMADEVLSDLSQHDGIQTVGRTSSWIFKDKAEDLRRVGRKLDVRYVVEGSLRQSQGALRLNVALIDTRDASMLWSHGFQSAASDVQKIEDAATAGIVQALGLSGSARRRQANPQAYVMYVRGKALFRERNSTKMREARDSLREAVRIDPEFAPAWAQLGGAIAFVGGREVGRDDDRGAAQKDALSAARRSIALDPNLAEGYQMLGFILGYETPQGRAYLRHALQLDPDNPQTVYWWGNAAALSGNLPLKDRAHRRAMELDPFWVRPVTSSAISALNHGHRHDAYAHVERLRSVDAAAALELEMALAHAEGDLSRVIELGREEGNIQTVFASAAKIDLAQTLNELGYVREALVIGEAQPLERQTLLRKLPDRDSILTQTREFVGVRGEDWFLWPLIIELARSKRYAALLALYDRPGSAIGHLGSVEDGNRDHRARAAPFFALALARSGRAREASQLFRAADEAIRVTMGHGDVPPKYLAELAMSQAVMGRKEVAMRLLEQAAAKGWFTYEGLNYRLRELPWFANLHGDPRFQRLVRTTEAKIAKERRETEALGLI
jgi:TolB-like protein/DNA-binding SARP family transcriptional activator/Tfp pilus assembly protein PilF